MNIKKRILTVLSASVIALSAYAAVPANALSESVYTLSAASVYMGAVKPGKVTVKSNYTCTTSAIRINWNAVSGASGYRVYRYNGSKWVKIKTLYGNTLTYRDSGLSSGTVYKYKVKAFKKSNGKTYWGEASDTKLTSTKAKAVSIISTTSTDSTVTLNWSKSDGNGYKVKIYRSGQWVTLATLRSVNTTSYTVTGLSAETEYKFRVTAYRTDTNGRANGKSTDVYAETQISAEKIRAICDEVVELVNEQRKAAGLSALTMTDELYDVAAIRVSELGQNFSHTRPNGESCFTILSEYDISYSCAGENIAWGCTSASGVMNGWMNSSGHKANILYSGFTKIGVGYDSTTNSWVQIFIG